MEKKINKDEIMLDGEKYMPFLSDCTMCDHFWENSHCCEAFPNGIPASILSGDQKHKAVLSGQKGDYICTFILS